MRRPMNRIFPNPPGRFSNTQQESVFQVGNQPYNMQHYDHIQQQMPIHIDDSIAANVSPQMGIPMPYNQQFQPFQMPHAEYMPNYNEYAQGPYQGQQNNSYMSSYPNQPMYESYPNNQGMNAYSNSSPFPGAAYPQGFQPYHGPQMNKGHSPFANPLQKPKQQVPQTAVPHPYPKQGSLQKTQPSGVKSIMNQFKTQDGSIDVNKMMNTAGQMMGTVNQVQSMFKGLGGIFKTTGA
ncbi:YppG family protein [Bacillus sp. 1P06AnD]|uniref:YppG family protein n=1 Tax=Bacillus sp. 1P06AnD TaxID=3132208 RepID=UPI0039A27365